MKIRRIIIVLALFISSYYFYTCFQETIPKAKEYGKVEVERFVSIVVNHASMNYKQTDHDQLIIVERNEAGDIVSVEFDLIKVGVIAQELVDHIERDLNYIKDGKFNETHQNDYTSIIQKVSENKGIVSYLPIASMTNIPLFSYLNLKIPIKYELISNVKSDVITDIQNYGINHVVVNIAINLTIQQNVVSPFFSEPCVFNFNFPLAVKLVNGLVPGYYSVHKT